MTSREKVIITSLEWQRYVFNKTTDPKQRERVKGAIERLENELKQIRGEL